MKTLELTDDEAKALSELLRREANRAEVDGSKMESGAHEMWRQAKAEDAQRMGASVSPALQRECGIGPLGGARYGSALGGGVATTTYRDPQTMFTRAEVLAILRAEQARHTPVFSANDQKAADEGLRRTLADLTQIFERME